MRSVGRDRASRTAPSVARRPWAGNWPPPRGGLKPLLGSRPDSGVGLESDSAGEPAGVLGSVGSGMGAQGLGLIHRHPDDRPGGVPDRQLRVRDRPLIASTEPTLRMRPAFARETTFA